MNDIKTCFTLETFVPFYFSDHAVTKERLASYERKITSEPFMVHCDIGALIYDLEQYLDILRDVHDALDLKVR